MPGDGHNAVANLLRITTAPGIRVDHYKMSLPIELLNRQSAVGHYGIQLKGLAIIRFDNGSAYAVDLDHPVGKSLTGTGFDVHRLRSSHRQPHVYNVPVLFPLPFDFETRQSVTEQ